MGDIQSRDWLTSVYFLGLSFHLIRKYVMYRELLLADGRCKNDCGLQRAKPYVESSS